MAAEIDVRALAVFASISESSINSLISQPTPETISAFLQSIAPRAKHCDEVKAQKTRLEVELETVVRTNESKVKVLQNSRDKALADSSQLRQDLQASESKRAQAEADRERVQQSIESDASESASLRAKVTSLENSHRDTLSLIESKSKEIDRLVRDLNEEHQKLVNSRKEVSTIDKEKQEVVSKCNTAIFQQTRLEQDLDLQKKNVDWYESERKLKNDEHQKFRREKNARLAELQQSLDQQIEQTDALKRSENLLRSQLEDSVRRNEELISSKKRLLDEKNADAQDHLATVEDLKRLSELHENSANIAKARVEELTIALDEAREDAAEEIGRIRAEIQEERNERQTAEHRIVELEGKLAEAEAVQSRQDPSTPFNNTNGQPPSTPARPSTPVSFTPRSTHRFKNSMSSTQLYSEYTKLEKELDKERKANEQLQDHIESMVNDLEASGPQIEELRSDQARLQEEVLDMSRLADQAKQDRDAMRKQCSVIQGQLDRTKTELDESSQMCRDLGSQVRRLLLEQQAGVISDAEYERLTSELEEVNQREMAHLSESQQYVNQYLLKFGSIAELQEINEKQLGTIRNLVEKLESQEAQEVQRKQHQLEQDLQLANGKISNYQAEMERMVAQTKSFVKERDMFRSMLTRRGQIDSTDFSRSLPAGGLSTSLMADRTSPAPDTNGLAKLVKELQGHLDNLRTEAQTSSTSLRKEISQLSERNSSLQTDASKYLGQLDAATQKYDMLQSNYQTLKLDHQELQRRTQSAVEAATKQEYRTQQAAEELVEAKGLLDGLRRECANLKAEKELWKTVEKRLVEDGESLRNERARLDQLNTNLQNVINEKDHSDAESRRRLQSQIESLEHELHTAKRKLEEELEDNKQTALRRSYEHDQSQKRIDELLASLSATREELAAVKIAKDHLQARVDEMTIELRSAEERLEVLARPPTTPARHTNGAEESALSHEQELAVEVSELKRDLDLKTAELVKAEEHVEEYKSIAQEAEERLQQFVETNDEDKADLQATLAEREDKVKDLEQRVEDLSKELNNTVTDFTKLRDEHVECNRRQEESQTAHQAELERLKAHIEKLDDDLVLYKEATKEQQKIAEQRQQNYETELVNHTEAVKTVQIVRAEANQLRLDIAEFKTRANNAITDLQQKESSWSEIESRYKQELLDIKNRREEVEKHNKSLHDSLETLNTQLATLRKDRSSVLANEDGDDGVNVSSDLSSFNETIRYLRQEKEIIEVRHHMTSSDLERTKRQLEFTQSQLDETRLKLDQLQRSAIDVEKNNMSHNKLMETLNELNLHRESAVTLRAEKKQAEDALRQRNERVEQLEQEMIPLKAKARELGHLVELKQGEMELLQKDRDSWQQRNQQILQKYDRVDPAELEELKTKCSELEMARDQAIATQSALQTQIDGFPAEVETARTELKTKLGDQFKARDRKYREEKAQLQAELSSKTEELEAVSIRAQEAEGKLSDLATGDSSAQTAASDASASQIRELESQISDLQNAIKEKDVQIETLTAKNEQVKSREDDLKKRLNDRLAAVKKEHEAKMEELRQAAEVDKQKAIEDRVAEIRIEVGGEKQTTDAEGTKSAPAPTNANSTNAEGSSSEDTQTFVVPQEFEDFIVNITPEQAKMLIKNNPTVNKLMQSNIRKRLSNPNDPDVQKAWSESGRTSSSSTEQEVQERVASEKAALLLAQEAEIARRVSAEIETLRQTDTIGQDSKLEAAIKEQQDKFEEEKKILLSEYEADKAAAISKAKEMEQKMATGKTNLLKNQAANSQAKLNVVKKAAEETPEKPVGEVWEIAKTAKPPPPQPPAGSTAAPATATLPASSVQEPKPAPVPVANGATSPKPETDTLTEESKQETSEPSQPTINAPPPDAQAQSLRSNIPQPTSGIPRGGGMANRGQRGNSQAGRNTGIPRPGSSMGNHAVGNTNNRGRGGPRGGFNQNTGRGGLNPNASQFTPSKRPREEGNGGDDDGMGSPGGSGKNPFGA